MKELTTIIQESFYQNAGANISIKDNPVYKKFLEESKDLIVSVKGKKYYYYSNSFISVEDVEFNTQALINNYSVDNERYRNFKIKSMYFSEGNRNNSSNQVRVVIEYYIESSFLNNDFRPYTYEQSIKGIFYGLYRLGPDAYKRTAVFLKTGKVIE